MLPLFLNPYPPHVFFTCPLNGLITRSHHCNHSFPHMISYLDPPELLHTLSPNRNWIQLCTYFTSVPKHLNMAREKHTVDRSQLSMKTLTSSTQLTWQDRSICSMAEKHSRWEWTKTARPLKTLLRSHTSLPLHFTGQSNLQSQQPRFEGRRKAHQLFMGEAEKNWWPFLIQHSQGNWENINVSFAASTKKTKPP